MHDRHPIRYYRPEDHVLMERAQTLEELHQIAWNILHRIEPYAVMICGPITTGGLGSVEKNLERFERAIHQYAALDHRVFTQLPFEGSICRIREAGVHYHSDMHLLETFYLPLFCSGRMQVLCFLPGWETSRGTRWEHEQALRLGIERRYFRPDFETDATDAALFLV